MSATTKRDAVDAAMSVAEDVAEGKINPAALDQAVADECRELFGTVVGDGDPLWPLHVDVARQVLADGGLSADELSEWLAVARSRAGEPVSSPQPPTDPVPAELSASGPLSPEIALAESGLSDGDVIELSDGGEPAPEPHSAAGVAADSEWGCGTNTSAMVELPDGRRIPSRLIAARGRGLPTDDRL